MDATRELNHRDPDHRDPINGSTLRADLTAGLVVFLVALPLCLGIAVASDAPPISGVLSGIIGGIIVGAISRSRTSVSGPAAGLTAVVAAQIGNLGFEGFLLAVVLAGLIQIALGIMRAGFLSAFVPGSVIKGLLAAIGVILILKQIPHLFGHDADPEGDASFLQPNQETTFSELGRLFGDIHLGATVIGLIGIVLLIVWSQWKGARRIPIPGPLVVVLAGVLLGTLFDQLGGKWVVEASHRVAIPLADSLAGLTTLLARPDFSQILNPAVWLAGLTIALVASLETILNLEAVDKLDPLKRVSPPSRELFAQGVGNLVAGLIGAIPVTSVIVRSSVNVSSGGKTRLSTISHGLLLILAVVAFPALINTIPLSALAAILIFTGFKLAKPSLFVEMWREGKHQFLPFIVTLVAIVLTDLLSGILIGLGVSLLFILHSNLRTPIRKIIEKHLSGDVLRIELGSQLTFLNRAALEKALMAVPRDGKVLLDARRTEFIDPDVLSLIHEFMNEIAPAHGVTVSVVGFNSKHDMKQAELLVDYCSRDLQENMTPKEALEVLMAGNERFRTGNRLSRDLAGQLSATSGGQHPMAVVLSCIDSRSPAEIIFDLGLGDIFSIRIAGNIFTPKVLGSIEFGCAAAGAKLILVLGHTRCGAVTESVNRLHAPTSQKTAVCKHLDGVVEDLQRAVDDKMRSKLGSTPAEDREVLVDQVARRNVELVMDSILERSECLRELTESGTIGIVGGLLDVKTGKVELIPHQRHVLAGLKA